MGCGSNSTQVTATTLGAPIINGSLEVIDVTDSNATVNIPLITAGDSNV